MSALAAAGLAVGAAVAVPLGPWIEFRRKRPVMIGMDLIRVTAVMSSPSRSRYLLSAVEITCAGTGETRELQPGASRFAVAANWRPP